MESNMSNSRKTTKVFIDGQAGTTGLQIHEHLKAMPEFEILQIDDASRKSVDARQALLNESDIAVLCLPDEAARESVTLIVNDQTKVLDASSAHRVDKNWVYGMAELDGGEQAQKIINARFVANPGCYPTGFVLGIRPLVKAKIVDPDCPLTVNAVSGYSGGGRQMIESFESTDDIAEIRSQGFRPYGFGLSHKHLPEMKLYGGLNYSPLFSPAVSSFAQGMIVSMPLLTRSLNGKVNADDIRNCLSLAYTDSKYVDVLPPLEGDALNGFPLDAQGLNGTNKVSLSVIGNDEQVLIVAQLDNLGKGASLAAVQNLKLMSL